MKVKFNIFTAIIMGLSLLTGNSEAGSETEHARVSIAISGGASKGAYEVKLERNQNLT